MMGHETQTRKGVPGTALVVFVEKTHDQTGMGNGEIKLRMGM
jgi:hypothetical protein